MVVLTVKLVALTLSVTWGLTKTILFGVGLPVILAVLFIAGLQSIPSSLYEASRVEGATKWEEFWFITFPMLSNVTLLVMVYTMVELFISNRNVLILKVYDLMRAAVYDQTSAMMWFYFLIVGGIMGIIVGIYRKCLQNKWS